MKQFKPMLACNVTDLNSIKFPVICTPKIDGVRCLIINGQVLSRSLKPIPNKFIQSQLSIIKDNLDGELCIEGKSCNEITSAIMSEEGEPDFVYLVFDEINEAPYCNRTGEGIYPRCVWSLNRKYIHSLSELLELENECLEQGFEGLIIRSPNGPYKYGRSTEKEGYLLKLKRFEDSEAEVLDFIPEYQNTNEQIVNELGNKKRSSHKANKVQKDTLGALIVKDLKTGVEFKVSSGFSDILQKEIWNNKDLYKGKYLKYKYMKTLKDKPRHPTFIGFRDERDF